VPYSDLLRGRASIGGQIYLVTTVTRGRMPLFTNLYLGRIVVRALHGQAYATTLAYVVMPDHLHWLVQLDGRGNLSEVVKAAQGRSALEINRARGTRSSVWQQSFHDHALRKEEAFGTSHDTSCAIRCALDWCEGSATTRSGMPFGSAQSRAEARPTVTHTNGSTPFVTG
jgi:putative transposase